MDQLDECQDCPLCMEPLEMDDVNFFPCTCGYQICRFCWHRLRTDENGLCPACRKAYTESPADYKPLTSEELQKIKQEKKQKELQRKHKVTESRKHLANVRVVQKNLVFVVGLSARLADAEQLKKIEYFGKFGKIHKVVINHTTSYAGSQGPSASAYVTYQRAEDALKAISQVNNIHVDGRTLKASLGTTKYCSHFMKNQQCPKNDCMYLHELGDEAASFTKEEMQQGKHQDFERKLQELYLGSGSTRNSGGSSSNEIIQHSNNKRVHKDSLSESSNGQSSGSNSRSSSTPLIASSAINSLNCGGNTHTIQPLDSIIINPGEGWPSLHTGGVCKDSVAGSSAGSNAVLNSSNAANSGNGGLAQGRKTRKHNGNNNGTNSNGSHTGAATTNGTSPRHTPTRDHHNTSRRARNEESYSSNGGSRSNRDSPGATASSSESNNICSRNYVSSSSSSTSTTNDTDTLTLSDSSNTCDHIKYKPGSVSPSSHMNQKRPKSQSPNSSNSSGRSRTNGVNSSCNQSHHTIESNQSQQEELEVLQEQEHQSQSPTQEITETEQHIPETELLQDLVSHELQVQEPSLSISEPASSVSTSPKSRASSAPSAEYIGDSSPIVNGSLTNHKQQLQELQPHLSLTDGDSDVLYADMSSVESSVGQTQLTILQQQQQIVTHSAGSEWALEEQRRQQLSEHSSDIWNPVRQNESTKVNDIDINADDLGFDPFEETNKALAEDIIIEKKQREEEQQRHQLQQQSFQQQLQLRQQQLQQQLQQQQLQHQHQSEAQSIRAGVKGIFGGTSSLSSLSAARLPPPGFNGLSTLGNFNSSLQQQQQQQRVDMNKLLPLLSGLNSSTMPQLNGLVSGRLGSGGPPPGLNLLAGLQHQGGGGGRLDAGGGSTIMGPLDPNTLASHQQPPPPPGLSLPKQEPFAMKELENGLRNNAFSSINSLNTINNVNSINTLNSLNSGVANSLNTSIGSFNTLNGMTSLNPLASLSSLNSNSINSLNSNLNFGALNSQAQQQQQNSLSALNSVNAFGGLNLATVQQQQQQSAGNSVLPNLFNLSQQPPMSQQSLLHQLALQNTQKGWNSGGNGGGTDLTALDPAIVSSGQLTDSRSDSPPDWLRMMEQHMAGGGDASLAWPSLLPHHHHQQQQGINTSSLQQLCGGGAGVHVNASLSSQQQVTLLHQQLAVQQQQQQQQQQRASMVWPPTSPPPGFSNISPLHQPKHQQTHKIDNV